ncbi:hypothetical protein EDF46_1168 [Frondihabitans sp. PhB188]|uniref:hypothetical protein n=1 Tax=Frondihabitans sp. PhB188 TaxID=2485200 RepID=UPI000F494BBF|nr:hypothetical protein [Frondihabitans sp. PhB188]ROQ39536.1 hypothetical protein EDF46_1168 [Frondihabitans sp. PhB188]
MADTPPASPSRRTAVIVTIVVVVVVAVIAVLVVRALGRSGDDTATPSATTTINPTPTPTAPGYTPAPTDSPSPSASIPVSTPSASASPGAEAEAVPLTTTAQPVSGVKVSVGAITAVTGKGSGIGEIDGPAIRFTVTFVNDTSKGIPLSSVVTSVTHGSDDAPANELVSVRKDFPSALAAGKTARATYTFTLAKADRSDVRILVDYYVGVPITVFAGSAPH